MYQHTHNGSLKRRRVGKKYIKRNNDRKHHNLAGKILIYALKKQYTPSRINSNIDKSQTSKSNLDIIVKLMKVKDGGILKATKEKY